MRNARLPKAGVWQAPRCGVRCADASNLSIERNFCAIEKVAVEELELFETYS